MRCSILDIHVSAFVALTLLSTSITAQAQKSDRASAQGAVTHTHYDDEKDRYLTQGQVQIDVPLDRLCEVAGDFVSYGQWTLYSINNRPEGGRFTILLKAVDYERTADSNHGVFNVKYDLDVIWPFGRTDQVIPFVIHKAVKRPEGGVDHLEIVLGNDSLLLDTFKVILLASGDAKKSVIRFKSEVAFASLVNPFFNLAGFRKNIEWRIVRVLKNLKRRLQPSMPPNAAGEFGVKTERDARPSGGIKDSPPPLSPRSNRFGPEPKMRPVSAPQSP